MRNRGVHLSCVGLANNVKTIVGVFSHADFLVQALEPAAMAIQELVRSAVFDKLTLVHDDDLIKVKNGFEFVSNGDEGMVGELGAEQALDVSICCCVEAGVSLVAAIVINI